jgi:hypothetical protein
MVLHTFQEFHDGISDDRLFQTVLQIPKPNNIQSKAQRLFYQLALVLVHVDTKHPTVNLKIV